MIREAEEKDFDEWLRMRVLLYPEFDPEVLKSEIEQIFWKKSVVGELDYVVFVHEHEENKLSGFVETSIRKELPGHEKSDTGYIESLFVDSAHRRRGIAGQLVAASEQWVKNKSGSFYTDTDPRYTGAVKFYLAAGFKEVGSTADEIILKKTGEL